MNTSRIKAFTARLLNFALGLHRGAVHSHINASAKREDKAVSAASDQWEVVAFETEQACLLDDHAADVCTEEAAVRAASYAELDALPKRYSTRIEPPLGATPQVIDKRKQ